MNEAEIDAAFRSSELLIKLYELDESADTSSFVSAAKRQHVVPKLLLRRFGGDDDTIFQLDTSSGQPRRVPLSKAASRRHFYSFYDEEGERNTLFEGFLSMVESYAAVALGRFLSDPVHTA